MLGGMERAREISRKILKRLFFPPTQIKKKLSKLSNSADRLYKMSTEMYAIELSNLYSNADLNKNNESENFIKMCLKANGNRGIKGSKNR